VVEHADELLRRQAELQAEARAVEADLQLDELLGQIGQVNRVGSAALGLMVWRDVDLTVVCAKLALEGGVRTLEAFDEWLGAKALS
jgi:hypothetical protein